MTHNRIISASLSPNTECDDVLLALRVLLSPWTWFTGPETGKIEAWFRDRYSDTLAVSFNSGRSALLAILRSFTIGKGDEVLVQSFSCVAVTNSVHWAGATPIYVDVDETLNIEQNDAEHKITKRTKAIIVQHTFGIPARMDRVMALAKKHHLILIEDCAHALGATYQGKPLGSFGDAAFFSFGRDKVLSSVFGGVAIIKSIKCQVSSIKLREYQQKLLYPSPFWILQQLLHPIAFALILPLYSLGVGKIMLFMLQKFRLLSFPVYREEKLGKKPDDFPKRYPNALAVLLLKQLQKLEMFNANRKEIAKYYSKKLTQPYREEAIYLRFPLMVDQPNEVLGRARQKHILLGNWYHNAIDPTGIDMEAIGYSRKTCPKAEEYAKHVINLPTRITVEQARRVLSVI